MSIAQQAGEVPRPPQFSIPTNVNIIANEEERKLNDLQDYVNKRLAQAESDRQLRLRRYASIDRSISTWQKLTSEDMERALLEESTGRQQGLPINLPLLATHLDDTVAFYKEIFAPESRKFYMTPQGKETDQAVKLVVDRMNRDAAYQGYGGQIARTVRSFIKYNCAGLCLDWHDGDDTSLSGNQYHSIDMYNASWDPAIQDLRCIATEAEWAATYHTTTRRHIVQKAREGYYNAARVERVLNDSNGGYGYSAPNSGGGQWGLRYVRPPTHIGLTIDGQDQGSTSTANGAVNWGSYGLDSSNAGSQSGFLPLGGFEKTYVYIWLDPAEFGLAPREVSQRQYELWKLTYINGMLVREEPCVTLEEKEDDEAIPLFFGFHTDDDLGEAQRSPMELMRGFQRFGSYLINVWILGARKSIYGITHYDPDMFNPDSVKEGQVAGWIPMKRTGRDIRTGLWKDTSGTGVENTIQMLSQTLDLVQNFFPSQAAPAQIAGMDRAVKNQISSFLTSAKARLRLAATTMDSGLFLPVRKQAFRNIARNDGEGLNGVTDEVVSDVLGSGLKSLDSERIEMLMRDLIGIVGTSEMLVQQTDLPKMFNTLSQAMNAPFDLGDFFMQPQQAAPVNPGAVPTPPPAPTLPIPGA